MHFLIEDGGIFQPSQIQKGVTAINRFLIFFETNCFQKYKNEPYDKNGKFSSIFDINENLHL
jgi:hypothetical protein